MNIWRVLDSVPIKTPLGTNCFFEKVGVGAGGDPIDLVVRTHHSSHFTFLHTHPKWHIERILYVLLANLRINPQREVGPLLFPLSLLGSGYWMASC